MIGAIIGDIVGSRFEFNNHRNKKFELFTTECTFTDDTVELIAIADAILNKIPYKESLLYWCKKYKNAGFSPRFLHWIENSTPYNSIGNGALMRIAPIAYFTLYSDEKQRREIHLAVGCSHNSAEAITTANILVSCIKTSFTRFLFAKNAGDTFFIDSKENVQKRLREINDDIYEEVHRYKWEYVDETSSYYDYTCKYALNMALYCRLGAHSFEDAIRTAVSFGGDSDTLASITGALAESTFIIPQKLKDKIQDYLPQEMLDVVERFYLRYCIPFHNMLESYYNMNKTLKDFPVDYRYILQFDRQKKKRIFNL